MKKILALLLCLTFILSALVLTGCGEKPLKLGLGVYTTDVSATSATEDKSGAGSASTTVAAVLVGEDGKIVKAVLDCASNTVKYTADGKAVANESFVTKYEAKDNYNMVAYGGAAKEWFEQAAAFDAACIGKTKAEIAGLKAEDGKGTSDLQSAGCTIDITGFVKAATK